MTVAYLAKKGYIDEITKHLSHGYQIYDHLIVTDDEYFPLPWVKNVVFEPEVKSFSSINEAAKFLLSVHKNWAYYATSAGRRGALIAEKLPNFIKKPIHFMERESLNPMGFYTLLDQNTLLYSKNTRSPFPLGKTHLEEFPNDPPSRAYLKIIEAFYTMGERPTKGDLCIEIGASPGGWTWVAEKLAGEVHTFDRAPLGYNHASHVIHSQANAFTLDPSIFYEKNIAAKEFEKVWLISDIICYPEMQLEFVKKWIDSGYIDRIVATIKFQGEFSKSIIKEFLKVENSEIYHLFHNKHELTFFWKR